MLALSITWFLLTNIKIQNIRWQLRETEREKTEGKSSGGHDQWLNRTASPYLSQGEKSCTVNYQIRYILYSSRIFQWMLTICQITIWRHHLTSQDICQNQESSVVWSPGRREALEDFLSTTLMFNFHRGTEEAGRISRCLCRLFCVQHIN